MALTRCFVGKSTEAVEEEENADYDFNPWSNPEKLEELLKELMLMAKTSDDENDKKDGDSEIPMTTRFGATNTASVVSGAKRLGVTTHQYYSSRQKFLTSYSLKTKQSFRSKAIKWFKNKL